MPAYVICFVFAGAVQQQRPQLDEDSDEDDLTNDNELGEPPPYGVQRNSLGPSGFSKQRYKCHQCEPPECSNPAVCVDALLCWRSRIRESTGEFVVVRT